MNKTSRQIRKLQFYISNILQFATLPRWFFRTRLDAKLGQLTKLDRAEIEDRVAYYNQLTEPFQLDQTAVRNGDIRPGNKNTYVFDIRRTLRYFSADLKVSYIFGDTTIIPEIPRFVKSRPISPKNQNSVLLKLNQIRHFYFVENDIPFEKKKDSVVWRGKRSNKKGRIDLLAKHGENPAFDIGDSDPRKQGQPDYKGFLSIKDQLAYKFILSIEGNDVASNLKWVMSSNSLCMMPKPRFETWFMEGRLKANHHYVLLKDDYSDLEEKVAYYLDHPNEALEIIQNAHTFVEPFRNQQQEELISLLVVQKYFQLSGQLDPKA